MQLKITRSQKIKGFFFRRAVFAIRFRAEYSREERDAINTYNLGGDILLLKLRLKITIKSLTMGHYIECSDLATVIETEKEIQTVCKNLMTYLEVAKSFDGRDAVLEF